MNNIFNINSIYKDKILKEKNYIFIIIDIETCNGRKLNDNAIINIAFMFFGVDYIFKTYCVPDKNITWKYLDENQKQQHDQLITKEDLKNAPNLKDVLIQFNKIIDDKLTPILLAHNSGMETSMLNYCYDYYNIVLDNVLWCNTINKKIFSKKSLEVLVDELQIIKSLKFHYADNDVYYLNKCLLKKFNSYEKLIPKVVDVSYKYENNDGYSRRYYEVINCYEKYLKNNYVLNKKIKIEDTKIYKVLMEGKENLELKYNNRIYSERYYRIVQIMNINDENFIIKSKISPYYILELKDKDYNEFINIIKNKFLITEKYNAFIER